MLARVAWQNFHIEYIDRLSYFQCYMLNPKCECNPKCKLMIYENNLCSLITRDARNGTIIREPNQKFEIIQTNTWIAHLFLQCSLKLFVLRRKLIQHLHITSSFINVLLSMYIYSALICRASNWQPKKSLKLLSSTWRSFPFTCYVKILAVWYETVLDQYQTLGWHPRWETRQVWDGIKYTKEKLLRNTFPLFFFEMTTIWWPYFYVHKIALFVWHAIVNKRITVCVYLADMRCACPYISVIHTYILYTLYLSLAKFTFSLYFTMWLSVFSWFEGRISKRLSKKRPKIETKKNN